MNITNNNDNDYYTELVIEIAHLMEAITLPELSEDELSLETLIKYDMAGKTYKTMENSYTDVIGKFYVPVLFPLVDKGDGPVEYLYNKPKTHLSNNTIIPTNYTATNYIELVIPKYIVMQFKKEIPKDTKFLIGFSGEHKKLSNLNIIGLYGADIEVNTDKENK